MRVLLNAMVIHAPRSGVGHYTAELLRCLQKQLDKSEQIVPHPGGWVGSLRRWLGRSQKQKKESGRGGTPSRFTGLLRRLGRACQDQYLRTVAWTGRFDLYHEPNGIPVETSVPTVSSLHDLSLLRSHWHPADRVRHFEQGYQRMLTQCSHFLTLSDAVRREIIDTLGVSPKRVTRIYLGPRPWLQPLPEEEVVMGLDRMGLPPSYLLYVGTIEPRKNILTLLRAFCDLPSPLRQACPLVLAGGWGWRTEEVSAFYESEAKHKNVLRLGYVAEEDLGLLYNGARALVYPSLYEGFGLPPVEMMACGGAVLASTAEAIAEVVGGKAHLIEPLDVTAWREAMEQIILDEDWREQLRQGSVEFSQRYSWERCADETLGVYRTVVGKKVLPFDEHSTVRRAAG